MKHYDKFAHPLHESSVPKLSMQIAEFACPCCHRSIRVAVPSDFVDWEKIAESYRLRLEETWKLFEEMSHDVEVMHGNDPAAAYVANRTKLILMEILDTINKPNRPSGT